MKQLLATMVLILVPAVLGNHYALHCKKWKGSCDRYNSHCADDKEQHHLPKSCCELLGTDNQAHFSTGRYTLKSGPFSRSDAWCDMHTQGGGWLTIMRREPSNENATFFHNQIFQEYEDGFGNLEGNFWYGLHAMEKLTSQEAYEMRLDMYEEGNHNESAAHAYYGSFEVRGRHYTLKLGNFTGSEPNLIDNLMQFNNRPFIARKHVVDIDFTCVNAIQAGAGWWYADKHCLSGDRQTPGTVLTRQYNELWWYEPTIPDPYRKFAKYEMKIRPRSCNL